MSESRPVALTGATGFVGRATLDALTAKGLAVRSLARRPQAEREGVEWITGDLSDRASLAALVAGAGAVIHVAGLTNTPDPAEFETANVAGTRALVEAAAEAGVQRFVLVSSLAAREPRLSAYGASKARAEELVAASGLEWTIVRPPGVYGPHDVDYLEMFRLAKRGLVPLPPPGRSSLIYVQDLAELLVALIPGGDAVSRKVFEPDDGHPGGWAHAELARAIGAAVGRRPLPVHLPRAVLARVAGLDRLLRGPRARLTPDRVGYMCHPDWVSSATEKVPENVWKPRIATPEGLEETARWYREHGWL